MKGDSAIVCIFCRMEELHNNNGRKTVYPIDREANSFICSSCIQMLLQMPQSALIAAFNLAREKGYHDKAEWLEILLKDELEDLDDYETGETRPDLVRKRPLPTARPDRNRIRT